MNQYFFDFDGVADQDGIAMPHANEAFLEALRSMPEYLAELLARDRAEGEMTCSIRENDGRALCKIVLSLRVEDANGALIAAPFLFDFATC